MTETDETKHDAAESPGETTLYRGEGTRDYCAFPSILETEDGTILCVWKLGTAHMADEGITKFLVMDRSGRIRFCGTAAAVPGYDTQNAELVRLRGGVRCYVDVQDYKNGDGSKTRTGALRYDYRDGTFAPVPGILTDTDGRRYGYVFDGMAWRERDRMLAMTFPEINAERPEKAVHLLTSGDGEHWTDAACLDGLLGAPLNESSFAVLDGKLYVFCRGYDRLGYLCVLDEDGKPLASRKYEKEDGIYNTGRPKLFVRDGVLLGMMRNRTGGGAMHLDLIRFDAETLAPEEIFVLDDRASGMGKGFPKTEDGYYAEPYFDGDDLCVVTYRTPAEGEHPDLLLLRRKWNGGRPAAI